MKYSLTVYEYVFGIAHCFQSNLVGSINQWNYFEKGMHFRKNSCENSKCLICLKWIKKSIVSTSDASVTKWNKTVFMPSGYFMIKILSCDLQKFHEEQELFFFTPLDTS